MIKAWCYYESRILGAHHGLISTYALETLVLYIFHVFNNSFHGPLEVTYFFCLSVARRIVFFVDCSPEHLRKTLQVLYRFLEFFSNFDWENFCVSLWGPVAINCLPDVTGIKKNSFLFINNAYMQFLFLICCLCLLLAQPPRKDSGNLLLSKLFLEACSSVYAVFPGGQESNGQKFSSKHFNVIDPLRVNNNLGRSVSKGKYEVVRLIFVFTTRC